MEPRSGAHEGVTRYRPSPARRWLPIAAAFVPLGFWLVAISRLDDRTLVPAVLGLTAVLVAGAAWWSLPTGVTFTPAALVVRTYRGTNVLPWADIITLERRWNKVWVMTREGWFVLPFLGNTSPVRGSVETRPVGDAIWWVWCERRGPDHRTAALDPWRPALDLKGRVVLRAPVEPRLYVPMSFASITFGQSAAAAFSNTGAEQLGQSLSFLVITTVVVLGIALAYHRWSCVIVGPDTVVVRSVIAGVVRVPRGQIRNLRESTDTQALGGSRYTRLAFDVFAGDDDNPWPQYRRTVRLPAPATAPTWMGNDPEYHRKWAWLHDQVTTSTDLWGRTPTPAATDEAG